MDALQYRELALAWRPGARNDFWFFTTAVSFVSLILCLGFLVSRLEIPVEPRSTVHAPERVARFITHSREKTPPAPVVREPEKSPRVVPPPEIKPPPNTAKPAPAPRRPRSTAPEKPLTGQQRQAREAAANSGLLKEMAVLRELTDTGDLAGQLSAPIPSNSGVAAAAPKPRMRSAARDSGAVDVSQHRVTAARTELKQREMTEVQEVLASNSEAAAVAAPQVAPVGEQRSQEEVTLIVDRHKGQLQALYNRARRAKPSLRGIVLIALTIAPDGRVTHAEIVSSELHDPRLEQSIVGRLKALQFGAKNVGTITVNYPIEFLP